MLFLSTASVAHCHCSHGDVPPEGCQPEASAPVPEPWLHLLPCSHTEALTSEPLQRISSWHHVVPWIFPEEAALQESFPRDSRQAALLHGDGAGFGLLQEDAAWQNHY